MANLNILFAFLLSDFVDPIYNNTEEKIKKKIKRDQKGVNSCKTGAKFKSFITHMKNVLMTIIIFVINT